MNNEFNVNHIKRKQSKPVEKKPIQNQQPKNSNNSAEVEGSYFVSASGVHKTKMFIPSVGNAATRYDYLNGNEIIDVSDYSIGDDSLNHVVINNKKQVRIGEKIPTEPVSVPDFNLNTNSFEDLNNIDLSTTEKVDDELVPFDEVDSSYDEQFNNNYNRIENNDSHINSSISDFDVNYTKESTYHDDKFDEFITDNNESINLVESHQNIFDKVYTLPSLSDLPSVSYDNTSDEEWLALKAQAINDTFENFKVSAIVKGKIVAPTITQFLVELAPGTSVNKVINLQTDIQLNLCLDKDSEIRINERVPNTKYVGIEVPNRKRRLVTLSELLNTDQFTDFNGLLPIAVGKDIQGNNVYADIVEMPHCLICGGTKSGKSVCLNTIVLSLIYKLSPKDVKFLLIDPKKVELSLYQGIPHLVCPVITELEYLKPALKWLINEMERRYSILEKYNCRELSGLNKKLVAKGEPKLPFIVFVMDECAEWISDGGKEVEDMLQKLAAKARAAGIHMILAAQRPSADLIKGSIKSQFDTRFAFKVAQPEDSRIILGGMGAEKLVGKGDLLFRYTGRAEDRLQACFIDNENDTITNIVDKLIAKYGQSYFFDLDDLKIANQKEEVANSIESYDPAFVDVARFVVRNQDGSKNAVVNKFNMSYNRVNRIFLDLEALSILGACIRGKSQDVLVTESQLEAILEREELI